MSNLKKIRQLANQTQYSLGKFAGIPQPIISLIENGLYQPNSEQKEKLSRVLGVDIQAIFPEE